MSSVLTASQVVPTSAIAVDSNVDEENIRNIALGLSNPSPFLPKTFDFGESPKPFSLLTPGLLTSISSASYNVFANSLLSPATGQFVMQSPFAFTNATTPQTTLPQMIQPMQLSVEKAVPVTPQAKAMQDSGAPSANHSSAGSDHGDANEYDSEPDAEDMVHDEDEYHENVVPSADESEASFSADKKSKRRKRKAAQPVGSHVKCFADLTDDEVAFMDFKELTRLMNAAGLTRQQVADTKARRRRLKNRQSARLCSNKKRELCNELSVDKDRLEDQLRALHAAHTKLQRDYDNLRQQYASAVQSKRARGE